MTGRELLNHKAIIFLGHKTIRLMILLIAVVIISFILVDISPIDPVQAYIGEMSVSPEQIAKLEEYWGVGQPMWEKALNWLWNILNGNFGTSLIYQAPVLDVIGERFFASLILMFTSWIISGVLGFGLGILAGMYRGSWIDKFVKIYCYILLSAPTFWIAFLLIIVFSVYLGWFPSGLGVPAGVLSENVTFWDWLVRLILPVTALSIVGVAQIAMFTRDKLNNVMSSDFILFAKARGEEGWSLVKRHGIRNILLPAVTLHFMSFSELFGGTVLIEEVFSYPGIGQTAVTAGLKGDVPLFLGIVIFSTIFVFCGNTIADIIYEFVDPRIKENETK